VVRTVSGHSIRCVRLDQPMYQDSVLGSIEPSLSEVLGVKPVADFDNDDSLSSSGSSSSSSSSSSGEEERDPPETQQLVGLSGEGVHHVNTFWPPKQHLGRLGRVAAKMSVRTGLRCWCCYSTVCLVLNA